MADNKNMELNDEMMENAAGGEGERRYRDGVVVRSWDDNNKWLVRTVPDQPASDIIAYCDIDGVNMIGKKVRCELVAMGAWNIVEFLD